MRGRKKGGKERRGAVVGKELKGLQGRALWEISRGGVVKSVFTCSETVKEMVRWNFKEIFVHRTSSYFPFTKNTTLCPHFYLPFSFPRPLLGHGKESTSISCFDSRAACSSTRNFMWGPYSSLTKGKIMWGDAGRLQIPAHHSWLPMFVEKRKKRPLKKCKIHTYGVHLKPPWKNSAFGSEHAQALWVDQMFNCIKVSLAMYPTECPWGSSEHAYAAASGGLDQYNRL